MTFTEKVSHSRPAKIFANATAPLHKTLKCIKESEVIAYDDLGTEAIRKLTVENMPMIVVIDSEGNNLYETAVII